MIKDVLALVDKGISGESIYIPSTLPRFGKHFGNRRAQYVYVGGDSGTGKSAFVHQLFILEPIDWMIRHPDTDIKLKVFAWLMERSIQRTKAKWIVRKLWKDYKFLMDVNFLLGEGPKKNYIPAEVYEKLLEVEAYFDKVGQYLELHAGENPTGIWKRMKQWATENGTYKEHTIPNGKGGVFTKKIYVPNDTNLITNVVEDHMGILGQESGMKPKELMDKMSEYNRNLRDEHGFSIAAVNQFNRGKSDSIRRTKMVLVPEASDFETSSKPYHDCDVAIGLLNPHKYALKEHFGWKVAAMVSGADNRFRAGTIMKNSYGTDDVHTGFQFVGEVGDFVEIPVPSELTDKDYREIGNPYASFRAGK